MRMKCPYGMQKLEMMIQEDNGTDVSSCETYRAEPTQAKQAADR